jgi:hypothetical protein
MADPVIVDDGGSTRIKRLTNGVGAMNGLLDVDPNANPPQSTESVHGPFSHITVVTIDESGTATQALDSDLVANDSFTISSANDQFTVGAVDHTGKLTLSLQGTASNMPLVEARQFAKKRLYEVTNAGPIQQISGILNGLPANISVPGTNIYTAVVLS